MYAVVTTGGKQYRVEPGSELVVERLTADPGATVTFDRVLLVGDGEAITVGTPTVDGATVSATVLGEALGPKLIIFKFKQKVKYRRHTGHRQHLTRVRIDEISAGGRTASTTSAEQPAVAEASAEKPKRTRRAAPKAAPAEAASVEAASAEAAPAEAASAEAASTEAPAGAGSEATEKPEKPKRTRRAATRAESEE